MCISKKQSTPNEVCVDTVYMRYVYIQETKYSGQASHVVFLCCLVIGLVQIHDTEGTSLSTNTDLLSLAIRLQSSSVNITSPAFPIRLGKKKVQAF